LNSGDPSHFSLEERDQIATQSAGCRYREHGVGDMGGDAKLDLRHAGTRRPAGDGVTGSRRRA
jgi:hypothetical protein